MKKLSFFLIIISLVLLGCEKEEIEPEPEEDVTTVVEGRVIDHVTKEPIAGCTIELEDMLLRTLNACSPIAKHQFIDSDENGGFKIVNISARRLRIKFWALNLRVSPVDGYNEVRVFINESELYFMPCTWYRVAKEQHHYLLIELIPE